MIIQYARDTEDGSIIIRCAVCHRERLGAQILPCWGWLDIQEVASVAEGRERRRRCAKSHTILPS
jgi:hypothetical protein